MSDDNNILLKGLDGSNPLAFLAALGALRTVTRALTEENVRLSWEQHHGAWRPRIWCISSEDQLLSLLSKQLVRQRTRHATSFVGDSEKVEAFYLGVRTGKPAIDDVDRWISALANDVHPNATNQLQTTRRDYFAGNIDQIIANTEEGALRQALFSTWRYDDKLNGQSLHLEPTEDRRHAYQWNKPNGDPNRARSGNMLGANRLAIEALPLFLGLPSTNPERLLVLGWSGVRSKNSRWTWPIWIYPLSMSVAHSLLSLSELQDEQPATIALHHMGVGAIFRCRRILVEQTPNLTPAISVG